jgi:cytochrome c oxidase assembly protein subunit 15
MPALMIAAVPVIILNKIDGEEKINNSKLKWIATLAIILLITQIIIGTKVRSEVDIVSKLYDYSHRENWINMLDSFFNIHAAFSFVVSVFCLGLFWKGIAYYQLRQSSGFILLLVVGEMALGLLMAYNNIPSFAQPLHLLFASMLIITLLNYRLKFQ